MKYKDIQEDLTEVGTKHKARPTGVMLDTEVMMYLLRALHVIASALDRLADRYCGKN